MSVAIKVTVSYYTYLLTVIVDGKLKYAYRVRPNAIIKAHNKECNRWSHIASKVTGSGIPPIQGVETYGS